MSDEFDLDGAGNIRLNPLVGYSTGTAAGMLCILRLEHVSSELDLRSGKTQALQLGMTPVQCRELSQALLRLADAIDSADQAGTRQ